jgi:hypothetical protein
MSVVYLYGFAPADVALPEAGLLGVGDAEVELIPGDGFVAVAAALPSEDFGADALDRTSGDMEWMAEQGLRHEQVIAWFVDHAAIVPSPLLTLFSSAAALTARLDRDADRIRAGLDRFASLREWDLKVGYDPARLQEHLGEVSTEIARMDREIDEAGPGKAFLLKRKRADLARVEGRAAARDLARQLLDGLRPFAAEVARPTPVSDDAPVVLNAALLIPRDAEAEALAHARRESERLVALGVLVQYTGPWAPYRFLETPDG